MADDNDRVIRDAQYRKGLSIAFFNATNAAVELLKVTHGGKELKGDLSYSDMFDRVVAIRDFFLKEHKTYYADVIAKVGSNYKATDTIEKLKKTTSMQELLSVWKSLSADERHDEQIIKVAKELKENYEAAQ